MANNKFKSKDNHEIALSKHFNPEKPSSHHEVISKEALLAAIKESILDHHDLLDITNSPVYFSVPSTSDIMNSPLLQVFIAKYDNDGTMAHHVIRDLLEDGHTELVSDFLSHSGWGILHLFHLEGLDYGLLDNKSHNYDEAVGNSYFYLLNEIAVADKQIAIDHISKRLGECNLDLVENIDRVENQEIVEAAVLLYRSVGNITLKYAQEDFHPGCEHFLEIIDKCNNMDAKLDSEFSTQEQF